MIALHAKRRVEVKAASASTSTRGAVAHAASEHVLQQLLKRLDAREGELRAKIADEWHRVQTEELPRLQEGPGDEVDRAFIVSQVGIDRSRVDRFAREVEAIVATRERIARGAGGICVDCGEPIGTARLRANPVADRCTDCQAAIERMAQTRAK